MSWPYEDTSWIGNSSRSTLSTLPATMLWVFWQLANMLLEEFWLYFLNKTKDGLCGGVWGTVSGFFKIVNVYHLLYNTALSYPVPSSFLDWKPDNNPSLNTIVWCSAAHPQTRSLWFYCVILIFFNLFWLHLIDQIICWEMGCQIAVSTSSSVRQVCSQ